MGSIPHGARSSEWDGFLLRVHGGVQHSCVKGCGVLLCGETRGIVEHYWSIVASIVHAAQLHDGTCICSPSLLDVASLTVYMGRVSLPRHSQRVQDSNYISNKKMIFFKKLTIALKKTVFSQVLQSRPSYIYNFLHYFLIYLIFIIDFIK